MFAQQQQFQQFAAPMCLSPVNMKPQPIAAQPESLDETIRRIDEAIRLMDLNLVASQNTLAAMTVSSPTNSICSVPSPLALPASPIFNTCTSVSSGFSMNGSINAFLALNCDAEQPINNMNNNCMMVCKYESADEEEEESELIKNMTPQRKQMIAAQMREACFSTEGMTARRLDKHMYKTYGYKTGELREAVRGTTLKKFVGQINKEKKILKKVAA